jgi:hypothetical protein
VPHGGIEVVREVEGKWQRDKIGVVRPDDSHCCLQEVACFREMIEGCRRKESALLLYAQVSDEESREVSPLSLVPVSEAEVFSLCAALIIFGAWSLLCEAAEGLRVPGAVSGVICEGGRELPRLSANRPAAPKRQSDARSEA